MKLQTSYLGIELQNPIIASACPLTKEIENVKRMEDSGVAAIVLPSLFEEEITHDQDALDHFLGFTEGVSFEANDFFPETVGYKNYKGEEYLTCIEQIKSQTKMPVIGSLNGKTVGGWTEYAKLIEQAGADALELNIYDIPTNPHLSGAEVEQNYIDILTSVRREVSIPVAIKVSPFFSAFAHMAKRFEKAGANGIVLFNRFLEPDYDLDYLEPHLRLDYSTRYEMRLPLHWTAILYGETTCSLAATRGIKTGTDIIKMIMAGADVVMIASLLYQQGIEKIADILLDIQDWMEINEYDSISQMKGSMSYRKVKDKSAFERANYMKLLRSHE
ncbi:MAG: dihydroorotate dehydrogenase-like protein [Halobacteriovoraceae bacterium]|nr:dihydroorotate dehydrogenase-like protein [Halobacteriovoraceae bacterium]